uniref:ATP synthase subunit a n=1 Tax=Tinaminyssus melloi TaxID=105222 RepID=A0A5Q0S0W4_9ACAR|nr:ATP synthase F0 subunit 6 [Tinaminyssus melloi]QGA47509.1 ATP synthase F0 subunit 6 [Tinaminyssus melloi]
MFTNLFSSFDPSSSYYFSSNWVSLCMPVILMATIYWKSSYPYLTIYKKLMHLLCNDMHKNIKPYNMSTMLIFTALFWLVMTNNVMGLLPYVFTATSHIPVSMSLSLINWLLLMLYNWINFFNTMMTHLVPNSTPMPLSPFMVLIETISNIMRPLTLSVRLSANMIAGHLILTLLSSVSELSMKYYFMSLPVLLCLMILESAVAIIQSYVFMTLMSLYFSEI